MEEVMKQTTCLLFLLLCCQAVLAQENFCDTGKPHAIDLEKEMAKTDGVKAPSPDRASDREKITAIIHSWEGSWNRHDMHALASLFHEDGIWVLWTGQVWKGRTAIEEGHAAVHKTVFRNSLQREKLEELTFVGPDAAVVRFYSTLTGDERAPDKVVRSRKILIATKRNGIWKVGWGQNTRLADSTPD
jgi:uncharacterized protein (TIGR02246 family)